MHLSVAFAEGFMDIWSTKGVYVIIVINATKFLPRQEGDLTISSDVTQTYEKNYWA